MFKYFLETTYNFQVQLATIDKLHDDNFLSGSAD